MPKEGRGLTKHMILIKNGFVYDPINKIDGEKMDIAIKEGKIVDPKKVKEKEAKVIDARGKVVMPGGVDIHSHVAGPKVNAGRLFRPEDGRRQVRPFGQGLRAETGFSVPNVFATGYRYAQLGYTTVMEAATPPLKTRHTHEEMSDTPILDQGAYLILDNNWVIMEYLKAGEYEKCAAFVAWMLRSMKCFGIKSVNPGGDENWGWGKNISSVRDRVIYFDISPAEIIQGLIRVNEMLGLPHSFHIHCNNLGLPGSYTTTLETFGLSDGMPISPKVGERSQNLHVAHIQFYSYGGEDWKTFESKGDEVAKYLNNHSNITVCLGQVTFDETTTMTADGPFEYLLQSINKLKWINRDVELETSSGIVPYIYRPRSLVNAVQWAAGLEVALLTKNPWQIMMSTDHPNAGPFTRYPRVVKWLVSKKAREETIAKCHETLPNRSSIASIDREYTLYEVAVVTRASAAEALGISGFKGHLGVGADADVAIYDFNPEKQDPSREPEALEKALSRALYTIKRGHIVVENGEVVGDAPKRVFWADICFDEELEKQVLDELHETFAKYYTVSMSNYPISEEYLVGSTPIKITSK